MNDLVVLVDENGKEIGFKEKIKTHLDGDLHRAFSIFIFNSNGHILVQKRSKSKYHSGGKWSNACCSHPKPGEDLIDSAHRRLVEELGFDCELIEVFSFIYDASVGNGLVEHEFDHVLIGAFDGVPVPCSKEVEDWKWMSIEDLKGDIKRSPHKYTIWLTTSLENVAKVWKS